jgi:IS1 family transposase
LNDATVNRARKRGRVVEVATRVIFGTVATVAAGPAAAAVSRTINTAFVERHNGTGRNRGARRARKTCRFSKDWSTHRAATFFSQYS